MFIETAIFAMQTACNVQMLSTRLVCRASSSCPAAFGGKHHPAESNTVDTGVNAISTSATIIPPALADIRTRFYQ
jgi:hypothetical protein